MSTLSRAPSPQSAVLSPCSSAALRELFTLIIITRGRGSGGQSAYLYALAHFVSERYVHAREAVCLRPAETALSVHGNVTPQARQSVNHHRLELALLGRRNS